MAKRLPYIIYKRRLIEGIMYYFKYKGPDGKYIYKSTGCRTKAAAIEDVESLIRSGELHCGKQMTFASYAKDFFEYGGVWVSDTLVRGTAERPAISESQIKKYQMTVRSHLIPFFSTTALTCITPTKIKEFRLHLLNEKKLKAKTINDIVSVLRIILSNAFNDGFIPYIPLRGIKPLINNPAPREAFLFDEAKTILNSPQWKNETSRFFNLIAACTGMRLREIKAIRKETLHLNFIDVRDQYLHNELRPTKTKSSRIVPICKEVYSMLTNQVANYDDSTEFIFDELRETKASDDLRNLLNKIMPQERKQHGYCFHSWRHFFNTYLLAENVPDVKVAAVLGHSTGVSSMQERYCHFTPENFGEVYDAQRKLLKMLTT